MLATGHAPWPGAPSLRRYSSPYEPGLVNNWRQLKTTGENWRQLSIRKPRQRGDCDAPILSPRSQDISQVCISSPCHHKIITCVEFRRWCDKKYLFLNKDTNIQMYNVEINFMSISCFLILHNFLIKSTLFVVVILVLKMFMF